MRHSDKALACMLLRVALGVNFLGHGAIRIYNGVGLFAATTAEHMVKSPLPQIFVVSFAHVIPWVELTLGLCLIAGLLTRAALIAGSVFMMMLTVGVTSNQQWDVAGQQLIYSALFAALLFMLEWNVLSVDALRGSRGK